MRIHDLLLSYPHVTYGINELIYKAGDKIDGLYYIKNGQAKVFLANANVDLSIWTAKKGDLLGITSFFCGEADYLYSTKSLCQKTKIAFIPSDEVFKILAQTPSLREAMITFISKRISEIDQKTSYLQKMSIKDRFIHLIHRSTINLTPAQKSVKFKLGELSELLGTPKSYVSKIINEYVQEEIILYQKGLITIKDTDAIMCKLNKKISPNFPSLI